MRIWVFLLATIILGWLSRRSLTSPSSHGFYRFFAWESILLLITLRIPLWFTNPFSLHQVISWTLLCGSAVVAVLGFKQLKQYGAPDDTREDDTLIKIEKTTELVTIGLYRYIRHPLYASLLLLAAGVLFKRPDWSGGLLTVLAVVFLYLTAHAEEQENLDYFGEDYREYRGRTKMFIPFIF